jgi:hypothetical protein
MLFIRPFLLLGSGAGPEAIQFFRRTARLKVTSVMAA